MVNQALASKPTSLNDLLQSGQKFLREFNPEKYFQDKNAVSLLSYISNKSSIQQSETKLLIRYAIKNKIELTFLEFAQKNLQASKFHSKLKQQYSSFLTSLVKVLTTLEAENLSYSLFKTLKPIPYTPVDIDLLLGSADDLRRAIRVLRKVYDAEIGEYDRWGVGINLPLEDEIVEPHLEIHAGNWIYLQKNPLLSSTHRMEVMGEPLTTLAPEAEILALVAHSLFKEQMITLNDVLSVLCFLRITNRRSLQNLLAKTESSFALDTFLRLAGRAKSFPFKLNPIQVATILSEKIAKDPVARSTFPLLLINLMSGEGVKSVVNHLRRETYIRGLR